MQKVVKDLSYHESAVRYNEELYKFAEELAKTIDHPEPKRWCLSVAKQHKFHFGRHQKALKNLRNEAEGAVVNTEDGGEDTVLDDERTVHRSAETGRFVDEETAEENPATTVAETVTVPRATGDALKPFEAPPVPSQPVDASPDPELAAEPVDAAVDTSELDARIDALHGPGAAAALDEAIADGSIFSDSSRGDSTNE